MSDSAKTFYLNISFANPQLKDLAIGLLQHAGFFHFFEEFQGEDLEGACPELTLVAHQAETLEKVQGMLKAEHVLEGAELTSRNEATSTWQESWKDNFKPIEMRFVVIQPPWEKRRSLKKSIVMNPGMAFGTGQHQTTLLALEFLEELYASNCQYQRILDFGTGSGILALAARCFWPQASILAIDSDEDAIFVAHENQERNQIFFDLRCGDIDAIPEDQPEFDLVVSNIIWPVLKSRFSLLAASFQSDLYLTGIIAEQKDDVYETAAAHDLDIINLYAKEEWIGVHFKK